jgi:hypothetical protein
LRGSWAKGNVGNASGQNVSQLIIEDFNDAAFTRE